MPIATQNEERTNATTRTTLFSSILEPSVEVSIQQKRNQYTERSTHSTRQQFSFLGKFRCRKTMAFPPSHVRAAMSPFAVLLFLFALLLVIVPCKSDLESLTAENFAIVQFDSRPLSNYWQSAAEWNQYYCSKHGHQFLYYTFPDGETCHYKDEPLASAWCKVKAMINAMEDHPTAHVFFYMDSDAVVDKAFESMSLKDITLSMKKKLNWNPNEKPIIFNQDGPCWWCRLIMKVGYTMCLNAGTVVWYRHELSEKILREWWDASMDSYETNPIKRRFRLKWPWEQDRQMAVYNRSSAHIQVASQPERIFMQAKAGIVDGWCLSHLPDAECYISHYCANAKQKQEMRRIYAVSNTTDIKMNTIHFSPV